MAFELLPHQAKVVDQLSNGKILWGGVGSGKSIAALAYYFNKDQCGDIYVITTAKKRDSLEWQSDAAKFGIGTDVSLAGLLHVDSWNNIGKYVGIEGATFIFDEQRLVGSGAWVKSFYKIAKKNAWMMLSGTPGDTWMDYIPVFVANGYYKNKTEFLAKHVVFKPYMRFPMVDHFVGTSTLAKFKNDILVEMPYDRHTTRHHEEVEVEYDQELFQRALRDRWNVYRDEPISNVSELFSVLRRIVYSDPSRLAALRLLMEQHPRLIVFYSFDYELACLRELNDTWSDIIQVAEWNGHRKQPIPDSERWVYLVQYAAGAEGWNCTSTNAMVFYSLTYSYKLYEQAQGRIDRLNTLFEDLFYYIFSDKSLVFSAVKNSLAHKKTFNERKWALENGFGDMPLKPWTEGRT
jgi:hypothetical protein